MKDKHEVLLSSDNTGNITVWDAVTGNSLHQYKGGQSAKNTVTWVGQDWLLSAPSDKPLLNVWQCNRSEQSPVRLFSPSLVSAMAVSPSGSYLVLSTQESINIYLLSTGNLLGVVTRHYQAVTVIKWTSDSSHFVSGGGDGQVLVWSLVNCISRRHLPGKEETSVGHVDPRYTWTGHALPVTGIHVGAGVAHGARVVTCSMDMTVKLYSLRTGDMLLSVSMTCPLTCVVMDHSETRVWVGDNDGNVHVISLMNPPRDVSVTSDRCNVSSLTRGHDTCVTMLSVSCDNMHVASGDQSGQVHVWDVSSGQIVRSLPHKGTITCLQFTLTPPSLSNKEYWNPGMKLVPLQKGVNTERFECNLLRRKDLDEDETEDDFKYVGESSKETDTHTLEELKQINHQLYKYSLKHILNSN